MILTVLTIIFFAAGLCAVLYSIAAGLSLLKYMQFQKSLPEKIDSTGPEPATVGPPTAEAYCNRARLLLKRQRFDAALVDCKRAIDLNPNHKAAHTLWEHALEKEIPPELVPEAVPEEVKPPPKKKRVLKKRKKIAKPALKKVAAKKKPAAIPVPEEQPEEEAAVVLELEPEKPVIKEIQEEVKAKVTAEAEPPDIDLTEDEEAEATDFDLTEVEHEPVTDEVPLEEPAVPETAELEEKVTPEPAEIPAEIEEEPVIAKEAAPEEPVVSEEERPVEISEAIKEEPVITEEAPPAAPVVTEQAEIEEEIVSEPAEIPATVKEEPVEEQAPEPPEEEMPVIKDRIPSEEPRGESLLEEVDHEKLREFEKGEATAADAEWTQYADKEGPEIAESKIQMNELPAQATGLKETIIDLKQAEAYNLQGETNISRNQFNNAIKDFSRAININPKYVDALINRGSAYAQLGRFNDALEDLNEALKYEKKDAELYNKRGEIFLQSNLFDQAIKDFSSAIVLNPMFSDAFLNRGRAYSEKGMPEEAMNDFNQAIKADSDHADMPFIDRAAPAVQEDGASQADRSKAEELNKQGVANMEKGLYDEAIKNFTQAIDLQTTHDEAYINRGRIYTQQNNLDKALTDFNQAVMFNPLNEEIYYWRAQAWKGKDDKYNMSEDLKLACEMGHQAACIEYKKLKSPAKK
jgi:tetratricopeptide (TPR) repeat protein